MWPLHAFDLTVDQLDDLLVELFLGTETTERQLILNNKMGK
jgi:hypothetical protein